MIVWNVRGYEISNLLDLTKDEVSLLLTARLRRRLNRGLQRSHRNFLNKIKKSITQARKETGVKPKIVKTHLRNMPILPEMIGAQIGCHNGRGFVLIEVKVYYWFLTNPNFFPLLPYVAFPISNERARRICVFWRKHARFSVDVSISVDLSIFARRYGRPHNG